MLFDSKEVRSELMRIFLVDKIEYIQDKKRNMLITEEKEGICQYEEIQDEEPKNKWNIFNLRDQKIFNTEIIINSNYFHKKASNSYFKTLFGNISTNVIYINKNKKEGNEEFKKQQQLNVNPNTNVMKMTHYFLFNKMTINSMGTYIALFTDNINEYIVLIINLKTFKQFGFRSIQEIVSFSWHPIEPCCFSYSTYNQTKHYSFSQENETVLPEIVVIDHPNTSSSIGIVKWFTAPNGQLSLLLTTSNIELYDITYKKQYEKGFAYKSFINACFAPNSSFFITYTLNEIFIFNPMTLDFKSYSSFPGIIKEVLITESSNYIYALISKNECNDILLYTIYNLSEDNYNIALYQSYNNTHLAYIHSTYKMHYNVYQLLNKIQQLERAELSSDNKRLGLLYKSDMGERYLCLFDIAIGNSVHQFNIKPLIIIQSFKGYSIKDFNMSYDYSLNANAIYFNWADRYISKAIINAPHQSK